MNINLSRFASAGAIGILLLASSAATTVASAQTRASKRILTAEIQDDRVIVRVDGTTFTSYRFGAGQKMPYFYPVAGPLSGLSLTTESSLPYPHHRSLWFGCDRVNGGDYWQEGNDRGQIVSRGPKVICGGPDEIQIADLCDWKQPDREPIIFDRREITITAPADDARVIEFAVTLTARTDIRIDKTNHSLFAARVVPELSVEKGGALVNAEGRSGEKETTGTPSAWMDYSGTRFGLTEGLAVFDAPGNLWHPAKWFTRDYGFFSPTNLNWIDEKGVVLKKGESLPLRYRVVVHGGDAARAGIEGRYRTWKTDPVRLVTVDPSHFHAALVQKTMPFGVSPLVRVYAPDGPELNDHLARIRGYNARPDDPTAWSEDVHTGADFFEKMIRKEKPGAVVVLAGNNRKKAEYIAKALETGFNVLADKPMAIDAQGYALLKKAFLTSETKGLLLYDIMTERSEVTNTLQKELIARGDVFGDLAAGTPSDPAIVMTSAHSFFKTVSGAPVVRPAWFFDPAQQGQGLTDVSTHLVDLVQWECFPGRIIRPDVDLRILHAEKRPTVLTREQFRAVTGLDGEYPAYLIKNVRAGRLAVPCNGTILYTIKGIHARIDVEWGFEPPAGGGDTHFSAIRGTRASVIIRQEKEQAYRPELSIEAASGVSPETLRSALVKAVDDLQANYPGIELKDGERGGWKILIPDRLRLGHEAHFGEVLQRFLRFLRDGRLPDWEGPNMLAKYWLTTTALSLAR
jgi:predicted dehydrogenase